MSDCLACGKPLLPSNATFADGCPCNAPRGVNHGLVSGAVCTCPACDPEQTGASRVRLPQLPLLQSWEQLSLLRELTKSTGVIHEAQILQLKTWGWVTVQRCIAKKTVIELDVEANAVTYNMKSMGIGPDPLEESRLGALGRSVKNLLGTEWKVVVKLDDVTLIGGESSGREAFTVPDDGGHSPDHT